MDHFGCFWLFFSIISSICLTVRMFNFFLKIGSSCFSLFNCWAEQKNLAVPGGFKNPWPQVETLLQCFSGLERLRCRYKAHISLVRSQLVLCCVQVAISGYSVSDGFTKRFFVMICYDLKKSDKIHISGLKLCWFVFQPSVQFIVCFKLCLDTGRRSVEVALRLLCRMADVLDGHSVRGPVGHFYP